MDSFVGSGTRAGFCNLGQFLQQPPPCVVPAHGLLLNRLRTSSCCRMYAVRLSEANGAGHVTVTPIHDMIMGAVNNLTNDE